MSAPRSLAGLLRQALALAPAARRRRVGLLLLASALCEFLAVLTFVPALGLLLAMSGGAPPGAAARRLLDALPGSPGPAALVAAVLLLLALRVLLLHRATGAAAQTAAEVAARLRRDLIGALAGAAWPWLQAQSPGRLAHALVAEVERGADSFQVACRMLGSLVQIAFYLAIAAYLSWSFTLALAAIAAAGLLLHRRYLVRLQGQGREAGAELRGLAGQIGDALGGFKAVKAMGREAGVAAWLLARIARARTQTEAIQRTRTWAQSLQETLRIAGLLLALWLGAAVFALPTEALLVALACLGQIVGRQGQVQNGAGELARNAALLDSLAVLRRDAGAAAEQTGRPPAPRLASALELRDLRLAHGDQVVLDGASARLPRQGLVALLGPSGSGKTTLLDLIAGLRQPDGGEILLDGRPLAGFDPVSWRRQLGYLAQAPLLLDASLAENLALNDPAQDDERLARALDLAEAGDFVRRRPGGLAAPAGPQGQTLSGGERQRIALARALLGDPAVLLLDEPTAALDAATAAALALTFRRLAAERLVVLATHDPSLAAGADLVLRLAGGRLSAGG